MAMPESEEQGPITVVEEDKHDVEKLTKSFLGLSFSLMLAYLPSDSIAFVPRLTSEVNELRRRFVSAEEQLRQMKSRRVEDSKANARVVEIFASHRNSWQEEEKRLLQRIDAAEQEAYSLTAKIHDLEQEREEFMSRIAELEREVGERDEMIGFMSRRGIEEEEGEESAAGYAAAERYGTDRLGVATPPPPPPPYGINRSSDILPPLVPSANRFWTESATNSCQDLEYESLESVYRMKHFVPRRESPWKIDSESTGISEKLRLLEEELLNLEKVSESDLPKVPLLLRKQAKRYQSLAGKIDGLCRRMQGSDPCDPTLSPEFRTQRQTEFLLECFRLQQRASETGQKLVTLQTEITKSYHGFQLSQTKLTARRTLDLIKNNLKHVQRNLEIWLARIIGDLEGILARDGASRVREFYISRYPFVQ